MDLAPIEARLQRIRACLSLLRQFQGMSYAEFAANSVFTGAAERNLQVAIQSAIDIAQYLLSQLMAAQPSDYADVFVKLGEAGVVPSDFAKRLAELARFRNVLVHLYLEVDTRRVHHYLQHNLDDFEQFARYVAAFVQRYQAGG